MALRKVVLEKDVEDFDPEALHDGGFMLFRNQHRTEGLRQLYRRVSRKNGELIDEWVTVDDFYREFNSLAFTVPADLFIPAGGRPETIDGSNWQRLLDDEGQPTVRVIVEGANSFLTPDARIELQRRGVLIMRDASANKCGVISSSYEIIANLLLTEKEFLANKQQYVADVLDILEQRSGDEARLILKTPT